MKSYSPYDNIEKAAYPNILVTAGLHDSQVQYWEPAKWVAKLREMKQIQIYSFSKQIWMQVMVVPQEDLKVLKKMLRSSLFY
jgi:hypothetical protein